jgi:hypothetical protein
MQQSRHLPLPVQYCQKLPSMARRRATGLDSGKAESASDSTCTVILQLNTGFSDTPNGHYASNI